MASHDAHERRVLSVIETGQPISQRSLSRDLGIALGLTNLLLRKMARKGWVRLVRVRPNRMLYFVTPQGIAEKTRMSRTYFSRNVQFYRETRDRIRETFDELSEAWPATHIAGDDGRRVAVTELGGSKRIVFYGAGEVAEIGYVCLQDTDLTLAAVVDPTRTHQQFFGRSVQPLGAVDGLCVAGARFGRLVVMSFDPEERVRAELQARGVPPEAQVWL